VDCRQDQACVEQTVFNYNATKWIPCWNIANTGTRLYLKRPSFHWAVYALALLVGFAWTVFLYLCLRWFGFLGQ